MKGAKGKRWHHTFAPIYVTLLFLVLIVSCKGPGKTNVPQDSSDSDRDVSNTIPIDTTVNRTLPFNQNLLTPNTDPLFFIDGQLCAWVRNIFQDKSGDLWFGTNHYGVMRYNVAPKDSIGQADRLQYFSEKDGVGGGRVTEIVEDKEGTIWFGTYQGLTKFDGQTFTNLSFEEGQIKNDIWSLTIDSKGIFWLGTTYGIIRYNGEEFTSFTIPKAAVKDTTTVYSYDRVTRILEAKNGTMWIGTDGFGICKYDGESFTHITKENGLPDNAISDLMEDSEGNIWIGTMFGGVSRFDGESFTNFTQDGIINGVEVGGFYEDKSGNIWFAAEHFGVYRYEGKAFTNFQKKDGLETGGILSIFEDAQGRFWLGGWGGLFRFDGTSFSSVTRDGPWDK